MSIDYSDKMALRTTVRSSYDIQKLRIGMGNRICTDFRLKLGQEPGHPTDEMDPEAQKLLQRLEGDYALLADAVAHTASSRYSKLLAGHTGIIQTPYELVMVRHYLDLKRTEAAMIAEIAALVRTFRIWSDYLEGVRGVGPVIAAIIISELDPYKAPYPSSFWAYAGLDVGPDGRGRSRRSEHLVTRRYSRDGGTEEERLSITFNPWLKTKLVGVLGSSFLKAGGPYREIYDQYKHRLESHPLYGVAAEASPSPGSRVDASKLHRHNMAVRYAVKEFLADLWRTWRELEGLPVAPRYAEEKLGLYHHQPERRDSSA